MGMTNAEKQAAWRERHKHRIAELEAEVARLRAGNGTVTNRADEPLTRSEQSKLDAAIRQEKRRLQAEFEQAVQDELKRALNEMVLPQYNKRLTEYQQVIKARKGIMSRATYRMILSWLHPDRIADPGQKEAITKAFHAFTNLELVLCNEKEMPTDPASIPRTAEEWMQRRKPQVKAARGVSNRR